MYCREWELPKMPKNAQKEQIWQLERQYQMLNPTQIVLSCLASSLDEEVLLI